MSTELHTNTAVVHGINITAACVTGDDESFKTSSFKNVGGVENVQNFTEDAQILE